MVGMFVCLCLTSKKPSEREFFVPAGTDLGVKLLMEPAPVPASKPASEAVIAEKKQQCIDTINDKLAAFPASLRRCIY
jgi:hypothetical protein